MSYGTRSISWPDGKVSKLRFSKKPRVENTEVWGWTNYETRDISISTLQSQRKQAITLIHEIIHGYVGPESDTKENHIAVEKLAIWLATFIEHNPKLAKRLVEVLCGDTPT